MPKASPKKLRPIYSAKFIRTSRHWGPHCRREGFLGHFSWGGNVWEFGNIRTYQFVGCLSLMVETMLEPPTSTITVNVWFLWHNWLISVTRKKASFRKKWALESFQMLLIFQMMLSFQAKPWPTKIGSQAVSGSFSAWHGIIARLVVELLNSWVGWDKLPGIPGGKHRLKMRFCTTNHSF